MGSRSLRRTQQSRKRLNLRVVASRPRRNSGLLQPGRIPPFGRPGAARHSIRTVTTRTLPGCPTLEKCTVNRLSRSGQPGATPGEGLQPAVLPSLARGFNLQIKSTFFIRVGRPGDRPECARVAGLPMGRRPARPLTRELIFNRMLFTQRNSVKTGGAENPAFILYNADRIRTCRQARRISAPRCVPGLPDGHRAVRTGCLTMKS